MENRKQGGDTKSDEGLDADTPHEFICPITCELMRHPCVADDGYSYERSAIERWTSLSCDNVALSPVTGLPLPRPAHLITNCTLYAAIRSWCERVGRPPPPPLDRSTTMQIFVRWLLRFDGGVGKTTVLEVQEDGSTTVEEVREMLGHKDGIPSDQIQLIFRGRPLDGCHTLGVVGVLGENALHAVLRLRGD